MVSEQKNMQKTNRNTVDLESVITKDNLKTFYKRNRLFSGKRKSREAGYKDLLRSKQE